MLPDLLLVPIVSPVSRSSWLITEVVCVRSVTRLVDLVEDLEGGREADRMQGDAQETRVRSFRAIKGL